LENNTTIEEDQKATQDYQKKTGNFETYQQLQQLFPKAILIALKINLHF
jgi:hypothetical protein